MAAPPHKEAQLVDEITINLSELVARTAGYHDGLNEIEATLFQFVQPGSERGDRWQRLASARRSLGQLRQLVDDYLFIKLYYSLLTARQQQQVTAPQSPASLCGGSRTVSTSGTHLARMTTCAGSIEIYPSRSRPYSSRFALTWPRWPHG